MKPTLKQIAHQAGVSTMAVSAVLHGSGKNVKVSEEKAERIRAIATALRYEPNHLARSLRSRKTRTVGLVLEHFERLWEDNPYYPQVINGILSALFPAEYTLALCPKLIVGSRAGSVSDGRFDGVIWCRPDVCSEDIDELRRTRVPVVLMHASAEVARGLPTHCLDNDLAMELVVRHLADLGHTSIAYISDAGNQQASESVERGNALLQSAKSLGISGEVRVWSYAESELLIYNSCHRPHSALVCFSDYLAAAILHEFQRMGVRVPQDMSVIGFDSSRLCDRTVPRLTSIFQPVERMAADASRTLLSLIESETPAREPSAPCRIYDCSLDVRDSTSTPPSSQRNPK